MARPRPSLSITLPPNFQFHYNEGQLPTTPEQRDEQHSAIEPPPPPKQTYKLRRRRAPIVPFEDPQPLPTRDADTDTDTVIPTIEMSESVSEMSSPMMPAMSSDSFLKPLPAIQRLVTPTTPAARMNPFTPNESPAHEWALINEQKLKPAFERSGSVCSSFSDSSVSSYGSSGFSAPNGGCTSPESEATDPFMEDDLPKPDKPVLSPDQDSPSAKRVRRYREVKWTPEMDKHLENTYVMYLRDPRVTPFKTLPGVPPPLGVCSRVANKARHTWSQYRSSTPTPLDTILEFERQKRDGSPDTIRPESTGNRATRQLQQPQWPRSDAATRRRLRKLVKGKPALSAHYQRLLRTRSPSPFTTSSTTSRSSEPPAATNFSGREMKMSLITSTAPSMQPEGPLAQLTSDDSIAEQALHRPQSQKTSRPADWFARIGRSKAHQKSVSLQSGLSLDCDTNTDTPSGSLASPFDDLSNRSHLLHSMGTTKSLGRSEFKGKAPSLDSPFEMQGAPTMPRSLKRRFKSDEEKPRRPALDDVFGPPQSSEDPIVRNRGFTVSAVRATDSLARMFDPPAASPAAPPTVAHVASVDLEMTEAPPANDMSFLGPIGSRSAPRRLAEPVPRLGSPFTETPYTTRLFNTFPRSYIPTASNPQPFQDRLRELAAHHQQT